MIFIAIKLIHSTILSRNYSDLQQRRNMFFSLMLRRGLGRRYRGNLYAYRVRYLILCLVLAAFCILAASLILGLVGYITYASIILYAYAAIEIIVSLIIFCQLKNMQDQPTDIIIVNHNIPMQGNRNGNPGMPMQPANQSNNQPLIQWLLKFEINRYHLGNLTFLIMIPL